MVCTLENNYFLVRTNLGYLRYIKEEKILKLFEKTLKQIVFYATQLRSLNFFPVE